LIRAPADQRAGRRCGATAREQSGGWPSDRGSHVRYCRERMLQCGQDCQAGYSRLEARQGWRGSNLHGAVEQLVYVLQHLSRVGRSSRAGSRPLSVGIVSQDEQQQRDADATPPAPTRRSRSYAGGAGSGFGFRGAEPPQHGAASGHWPGTGQEARQLISVEEDHAVVLRETPRLRFGVHLRSPARPRGPLSPPAAQVASPGVRQLARACAARGQDRRAPLPVRGCAVAQGGPAPTPALRAQL
jgi:hypothetical protein